MLCVQTWKVTGPYGTSASKMGFRRPLSSTPKPLHIYDALYPALATSCKARMQHQESAACLPRTTCSLPAHQAALHCALCICEAATKWPDNFIIPLIEAACLKRHMAQCNKLPARRPPSSHPHTSCSSLLEDAQSLNYHRMRASDNTFPELTTARFSHTCIHST